jgi:SAM-dependent methyltransferase
MTEWFEQWFGEEYLQLYPHRDAEEAAEVVALMRSVTSFRGARVLDLACGPGRHAERLRAAPAHVVGFDLSMPLLSRARHRTHPPLSVVRGDMRALPFRNGSFDLVVNLFTSFGYFAEDRQHHAVLQGVAAVLRDGGTFVLDYFNAEHVIATLVSREERAVGTSRVAIERRLTDDHRYVVKEMHLVDDGRSFLERVRLFGPTELEHMLAAAGLTVTHRFGDYGGAALTPDSPRVFLVARRQ